jgi:ribonuclease D
MTTEIIETALIKIKPDIDPIVIALTNQATSLLKFAESRAIVKDEDVKYATEDLSMLAKIKKAIEDKQKEYTNPINDHLKAVREAFKMIVTPLEQADKLTREKILAYRHEQERKAREAEEINRMRMEAARKEMELKGELTESVNLVEVIPEQPKHVHTEVGSLGTSQVWKFEVTDFNLLPNEYKIVDSSKLGKVVRAGLHTIPGVNIWPEETIRISSK